MSCVGVGAGIVCGGMMVRHIEDDHCIALWEWAQHVPLLRKYLYHLPNGGKRNVREAARFKKMGVRPGVSDYHLPLARGPYIGLYIEMKAPPNGRVQDSQKTWGESVTDAGHAFKVAYGFDMAKDVIEWYLALGAPEWQKDSGVILDHGKQNAQLRQLS